MATSGEKEIAEKAVLLLLLTVVGLAFGFALATIVSAILAVNVYVATGDMAAAWDRFALGRAGPQTPIFYVMLPILVIGSVIYDAINAGRGRESVPAVLWPKESSETPSLMARLGRLLHWTMVLIAAASFTIGVGYLIAFDEIEGLWIGLGAGVILFLIGRAFRYLFANE